MVCRVRRKADTRNMLGTAAQCHLWAWESFRKLAAQISGECNREPRRLLAAEEHQASWVESGCIADLKDK